MEKMSKKSVKLKEWEGLCSRSNSMSDLPIEKKQSYFSFPTKVVLINNIWELGVVLYF